MAVWLSQGVAGMGLVSGSHCVQPESGARLWERPGSGERGRPRGQGGAAGRERA